MDIEKEARVVTKVCSPIASANNGIVKVFLHDWLPPDHHYYFLDMEYCEKNLKDHLAGCKPLDPTWGEGDASFCDRINDAVKISNHITHGLAFIHALDVVHRDLTPQNSMIPVSYHHLSIEHAIDERSAI